MNNWYCQKKCWVIIVQKYLILILSFITCAHSHAENFMLKIINDSSCTLHKESTNLSTNELIGPTKVLPQSDAVYFSSFSFKWSNWQKRYTPKEIFFKLYCPTKTWFEYLNSRPTADFIVRYSKNDNSSAINMHIAQHNNKVQFQFNKYGIHIKDSKVSEGDSKGSEWLQISLKYS